MILLRRPRHCSSRSAVRSAASAARSCAPSVTLLLTDPCESLGLFSIGSLQITHSSGPGGLRMKFFQVFSGAFCQSNCGVTVNTHSPPPPFTHTHTHTQHTHNTTQHNTHTHTQKHTNRNTPHTPPPPRHTHTHKHSHTLAHPRVRRTLIGSSSVRRNSARCSRLFSGFSCSCMK